MEFEKELGASRNLVESRVEGAFAKWPYYFVRLISQKCLIDRIYEILMVLYINAESLTYRQWSSRKSKKYQIL